MAGNANLGAAKTGRNDEFYTQLTDIEKELRHYRQHFRDKTVLCNCDDPFESNFFKYFVLNFNRLGLKKLIATCYAGSPIANQQLSLFDVLGEKSDGENHPYKAVVTSVYDKTGDGGVDMLDVAELFKSGENELTELEGDGDFRSPECLALLDEADIVVTNPPFSLFQEYVMSLEEHKKGYIIIGSINAITYKGIFPLIKDNKMWIGAGFNLSMVYKTPYPNLLEANKKFVEARGYNPDEGYVKVPATCWFTNLDLKKRHEDLILVKKYAPALYPKYETFDAIDVSNVSDIPYDFAGIMGVPKTFMQYYNPEQFEILGYEREDENIQVGIKNMPESFLSTYRRQGGKGHYTKGMKMLCFYDNEGLAKIPFSRILIRNKHPEESKK